MKKMGEKVGEILSQRVGAEVLCSSSILEIADGHSRAARTSFGAVESSAGERIYIREDGAEVLAGRRGAGASGESCRGKHFPGRGKLREKGTTSKGTETKGTEMKYVA